MPPKVFISYSHDSEEHQELVLSFADRLRDEGINCNIDQYETSPHEGWSRWAINQIEEAEFVMVVCTDPYQYFSVKL
jgi:SEFIR domain